MYALQPLLEQPLVEHPLVYALQPLVEHPLQVYALQLVEQPLVEALQLVEPSLALQLVEPSLALQLVEQPLVQALQVQTPMQHIPDASFRSSAYDHNPCHTKCTKAALFHLVPALLGHVAEHTAMPTLPATT